MESGDTREHTIVAKSGDAESSGSLTVVYFSPRQRIIRALKAATKCLCGTTLCVFIPGAHFILVPLGLLIVTPVISLWVYLATTKIVSAAVGCPKCQSPLRVLTTQERYPMYENCALCHRQAIITRGA